MSSEGPLEVENLAQLPPLFSSVFVSLPPSAVTASPSHLSFRLIQLWLFCATVSLLSFKTGLVFAFLTGLSFLIGLLSLWW